MTKVIEPVVGDVVSSRKCGVHSDPVIEVNEMGFICKRSGQWEGTTEDWTIKGKSK